jgi:hypothetical protein
MEVYVLCNTGYEEREFLGVFSTLDAATQYASKKWGQYDNIIVYKHKLDSRDLGEIVFNQRCVQVRN